MRRGDRFVFEAESVWLLTPRKKTGRFVNFSSLRGDSGYVQVDPLDTGQLLGMFKDSLNQLRCQTAIPRCWANVHPPKMGLMRILLISVTI